MSTAADPLADPELLETEWDLAPLVDGDGDDAPASSACSTRPGSARRRSPQRTRARWPSSTPAGLHDAMRELEAINELVGRAGSYASLRFATDTADPARGALLQLVQERATEIETLLLFFELEWAALDDDRAEELLAGERLDFCRHHLRSVRRYRPHLLSETEEKILAEKSISSQAAWSRLFGELVAALRVAARRRGADARRRAQPPAVIRPRDPSRGRRGGLGRSSRGCARAASSTTRSSTTSRSRTGCVTTRTGWPAATWPTRPPTSR